jgi:anthranilate phosphoribosyltransferase
MTLAEAAQHCRHREPLPPEAAPDVVSALLNASVPDPDKAAFLLALNEKGITSDDLVHFTRAILPHAVDPGFQGQWDGRPLFDCCGTGGGGLNLLNVSTAIMFILAAAGVPVVKHGNRGITKKSGSADVLEALGVKIEMSPKQLQDCLNEVGCTFLFAPAFHPAFKAVGPVRKQLGAEGHKTIFNLLGPLLNPCQPETQMVGVFQRDHLKLFSKALTGLGRECHLIVYGMTPENQPLGEFSSFMKNFLEPGPKLNFRMPAKYDVREKSTLEELLVKDARESAAKIEQIFREPKKCYPGTTLILANAAAGLVTHGKSENFEIAFRLAEKKLDSGEALAKLETWRRFSASLGL